MNRHAHNGARDARSPSRSNRPHKAVRVVDGGVDVAAGDGVADAEELEAGSECLRPARDKCGIVEFALVGEFDGPEGTFSALPSVVSIGNVQMIEWAFELEADFDLELELETIDSLVDFSLLDVRQWIAEQLVARAP